MARYRKKPVEIEAIKYTGSNYDKIAKFAMFNVSQVQHQKKLVIRTLEGNMIASKGDYIIKGVKGEFYPCKNNIFLETYEKVEE